MKRALTAPALIAALTLCALPGPAAAAGKAALVKPVKTLITSVRYGKDAKALQQLAGDAQGEALLGADWAKGTPAQRREFTELFHTLFAGLAFPQIRANFKHLETITYAKPEVKGDRATLRSTLVILHPAKKQEIQVEYTLLKKGKAWKVVDVLVLGTGGESMMAGIRTEQVRPLFERGGWDGLLEAMRARAAKINPKK